MKPTQCTSEGCTRTPHARGVCNMHYLRMKTAGELAPISTLPADRLARRLIKAPSGCIEWTGYRSPAGYGKIRVGGKGILAHRFAWELVNGPIPPGMCVCHRCDNPPCCNVAHLWLGTQADNNADMYAKGRSASGDWQRARTHCPRGHAYDEANTYVCTDGRRMCRSCWPILRAANKAKKTAANSSPTHSLEMT